MGIAQANKWAKGKTYKGAECKIQHKLELFVMGMSCNDILQWNDPKKITVI